MTINDQINAVLDLIEREENVRVLYACESGSRAWGFASADSDYDVRFIYVHPAAKYLTVSERRDVIERPVDGALDLAGWDLPKTLGLMRKSNPPLFEWLQSPIVYREFGYVPARLRDLVPQCYSPAACLHHYLHMAERNFRQYLQGDAVWLKKYFYVLRPVLACLWVERGLGVAPMEFQILVDRLVEDTALKTAIDTLTHQKRQGLELERGPRIPVISEFLEHQLARLKGRHAKAPARISAEVLDQLFQETLVEIYGNRIV